MAFEFLHEVGVRSGIYDRRFILGVFFPTLIGILIAFVLTFAAIPTDLIIWFYLFFIAFTLALLLMELSSYVCWSVTRAGTNYNNFLSKNIQKIFIEPVKENLRVEEIENSDHSEKNLKKFLIYTNVDSKEERINLDDYYRLCEILVIPHLTYNARQDYVKSYFIPKKRYNHESLMLVETRLLQFFTMSLMSLFNLILAFIYSNISFDLVLFKRDQITSDIAVYSVLGLCIITFLCLIFLFKTRKFVWIAIIKSTNVPFIESPRETNIRNSMTELLTTLKEKDPNSSYFQHLENSTILNSALISELNFNIRQDLLQRELEVIFRDAKEIFSNFSAKKFSQVVSSITHVHDFGVPDFEIVSYRKRLTNYIHAFIFKVRKALRKISIERRYIRVVVFGSLSVVILYVFFAILIPSEIGQNILQSVMNMLDELTIPDSQESIFSLFAFAGSLLGFSLSSVILVWRILRKRRYSKIALQYQKRDLTIPEIANATGKSEREIRRILRNLGILIE